MKKRVVVFDASSILAWIHREEGHERIASKLYNENIERYIYAVNMAEIQYRLLQIRGDRARVKKVTDLLIAMGMKIDYTMNAEIIERAASIREKVKSARFPISLADCFGVAATELKKKDGNAEFMTTDETEFKKAQDAGLIPVKVDIIPQPSKHPLPEKEPPKKRQSKKSLRDSFEQD